MRRRAGRYPRVGEEGPLHPAMVAGALFFSFSEVANRRRLGTDVRQRAQSGHAGDIRSLPGLTQRSHSCIAAARRFPHSAKWRS